MNIIIATPYWERYVVDEKWQIIQLESAKRGEKPSGQWAVAGVGQILPFGQVRKLPKEKLLELVNADKSALCFKNGKPRYTIFDNDHGTLRCWGNWNVHGIQTVYKYERSLP